MPLTILYKFRSGKTFEALSLPGSAARLVDVKKAIVKAKKLNGLDFELSVNDATTNQEYVDENMVLPRGTRVIVQRLPAARGHGFLARMARADAGFGSAAATTSAAPSGFYTIDCRNDEEEEFVSTFKPEEEKELAELMAVTDPGTATSAVSNGRVGGKGTAPLVTLQERSMGALIPMRIRNYVRSSHTYPRNVPRLVFHFHCKLLKTRCAQMLPSFKMLIHRGGGQSEITRDLDYALKFTSTDIPEHLQCGICHGVVKNAMLLPWDMEGRTACESCIRSALTESGFRCPLTGMEGVSPDDLHPNHGLRKAAELFVKGVMEKMDEIDRQQVDEPDTEETTEAVNLEGESGDRGAIVSRRTMKDHSRTTRRMMTIRLAEVTMISVGMCLMLHLMKQRTKRKGKSVTP